MSERRDEILRIAARIFAERGYVATTVREIAEEAGILSGSLYHHFASKSQIAEEIVLEFFGSLIHGYESALARVEDPVEVVEALVREAFQTVERHPYEIAVVQNDWQAVAEYDWFHKVEEAAAQIEELWVEAFRAGAAEGAIRDDVEFRLLYRFVRDAVWMSVRWYRPERGSDIQEIARAYLALLLDGIRRSGEPGVASMAAAPFAQEQT